MADMTARAMADEAKKKALDNATQLAEKAKQTEVDKFNSQADFVELIKNRKSYSRMRFQKMPDNSPYINRFGLALDDGTKHTTYTFTKDPDDDFFKLNNGYVGSLGEVAIGYDDGVKTGTWSGSSPFVFTQQIGATVTGSVKGATIKFNVRTNNVGGLWEVVVDGDTANKVMVSCYSDVDSNNGVQFVVKTGLDRNVLHTVVATFKGDDPAHVPAGGAGTSRGYVNVTNDAWYTGNGKTPVQGFITSYISDGNVKGDDLLALSSNKEFAFNIKYGAWQNWIPEHDSAPVLFNVEPPQYLLDGKALDITTMAISEYKDCSDFRLIQHVYARANAENIAEIRFTHRIDKTGIVSITGNIVSLKDFTLDNIYPLMLPAPSASFNEVLTGIGNAKTSTGDNTDTFFNEELDRVRSMALLSSSFKNYVTAGTIENHFKTVRVGKPKGTLEAKNTIRYWQSPSPKAYWTAGQGLNFPTGSSYSWFGKIAIAEIKDIYYHLKSNF